MKLPTLLATALFGALASQSTSAEVISSNLYMPPGYGTGLGNGAWVSFKAFGFTMGAESYVLDDVVVTLRIINAGATPYVSIWDDSGSYPGTELIVLDPPPLPTGSWNFVFTPGTPFVLEANSTYWLHVRSEPIGNPLFVWYGTDPGLWPQGIATPIGYRPPDGTFNRLEFNGSRVTGLGYCFGDPGVGTPCPCGNDNDGSVPGSGCDNGAYPSGAHLIGTGVAQLSNDTLVLRTTGLEPGNTGLYIQADDRVNNGNGAVFGDGLRCVSGGQVRLQVLFADANGYSETTVAIAATGGVSAGDTKHYQCWYRTTQNPPCGLGVNDFNLSNALEIAWVP